MYFSIFKYNTKDLIYELNDRDKMHKFIMQMFDGNRAEEQVLYFVKEFKERIGIQSVKKPDFSRIKKLELVYQREINYDRYVDEIPIRMEVHALPTKNVRRENKNSIRVTLKDEAEKEEWLKRRLEECGVFYLGCLERSKSQISVRKKGLDEHKRQIDNFVIVGIIKDNKKFAEGCAKGIGQNKCYGSGLLLPFVWK